ncbi:MAG: STAS domain-containing protein, partial [Myxococcales bacterium]
MLPAFAIEHVQATADRGEIRLRGILSFAEAGPLWTELRRLETTASRGQTLDFEMSQVQRIDGGAMGLLACLRTELQRRGVKSEFLAAGAHVQRIIHLYGGDHTVARLKRRRPLSTLDQLGRATLSILIEVKLVFAFFGQMVVSGLEVLRSPRSANWRELPATMERSGADAVPIILLINFLVGLAMAFQVAAQLKQL